MRDAARAWLSYSFATIFFGYAFYQRTAPSAIFGELSQEFGLDAAVMGALASAYFYSYAAMQIPAGILLDRIGPVPLLTLASSVACIASLLFSQGRSVVALILIRLLVGACVSVGWISILALVPEEKTFDGIRQGLTGFAMAIGLVCGMIGQAPLAVLSQSIGWRLAVGLTGSVWPGVCGLGLMCLWLDSRRASETQRIRSTMAESVVSGAHRGDSCRDLKIVCSNRVNIAASVYALFFFSTLLSFASLWSVPFVQQVARVEVAEAGLVSSMFLAGCAAGAPLGGMLSDHLRNKKKRAIMLGSLLLGLLSMAAILLGTGTFLATGWVAVFQFTAGLGQGPAQVLMYFVVAENNSPNAKSAAMALVNAAGLMSGAIFQPLLGLLLDLSWDGTYTDGQIMNRTVAPEPNTTDSPRDATVGRQRSWHPNNWRIVLCSVFGCVYILSGLIIFFCFPVERGNAEGQIHSSVEPTKDLSTGADYTQTVAEKVITI